MEGDFFASIVCPNLFNDKRCGTSLTPTSKYCPECGIKVKQEWFRRPEVRAISTTENMYVCEGLDDDDEVCGKEVSIYTKFCSHCGTRSKYDYAVCII